jgi:hypothetical protein
MKKSEEREYNYNKSIRRKNKEKKIHLKIMARLSIAQEGN